MVLVLLASWLTWNAIASGKMSSRLDAIRAAGDPVTMADLARTYPEPPEGENAADLHYQAFALMPDEEGHESKEDLPLVGSARMPDPSEPLSPAMLADVRDYLTSQQQVLTLLEKGTRRKACRFDLDFGAGSEMCWPHVNKVRSGVKLFALQSMCRIENGDSQGAVTSIRLGFGLRDSLRHEPTLASPMARIAFHKAMVDQLQRCLCRCRLSVGEIRALAIVLRTAIDRGAAARAFVAERCFGINGFEDGELKRMYLLTRGFMREDPGIMGYVIWYAPSAWFKQDLRLYLEGMDELIRTLRLPYPESLVKAAAVADRLAQRVPKHYVYSRAMLYSLPRYMSRFQFDIAVLDSARTAVAVERFRIERGRLPDTLDELVPAFVDAVPPDPFDGRQLRYRPTSNGFCVYSVGRNKVDDGGCDSPDGSWLSDLVFRVSRAPGPPD